MRLRRLDIRGFGQLRGGVDLDPGPGRIGLVLERNEAGKSTLAAALLAALYGLEGDRRRFRGTISDVDRYRPWKAGAFGLVLTLEHEGRDLVVERDFERQTVRVLSGGDDVTDRFRRGSTVAVGETLTGLTREQYRASVFVGQNDIAWSDPARLTEALQRVADTSSGQTTADRAIQALEQALERYRGLTLAQAGRVETEIKRCEETVATSERELATLDDEYAALDGDLAELENSRADEVSEDRERAALRRRRLLTEEAAITRLLDDDDRIARDLAERRAQVAAYDDADARVREASARVSAQRRRLELAARDTANHERESTAALEEVGRLERRLDEIGLASIPDRAGLDRLEEALRRQSDAAREHESYLQRLDKDRADLEDKGSSLAAALVLVREFGGLSDEDRVLLVGRTGRRIERDETRRELESKAARARQTVESIESAQDTRRRGGWITLLIGLILAIVVFVLGDAIRLPAALLFSAPALVAALGLVATSTASRHREADAAVARATIESAVDDERAVERREADEEQAWSDLAGRLGIAPEHLGERYDEWHRVEHSAQSASVHRERADRARDDRVRALEDLAGFEDVFGEAATEVVVARWSERARQAVAVAEDLARRREALAQRSIELQARRDEVASIRHDLLEEIGVWVSVDADPELDRALEGFEARVREARERDEARHHTIPALEARRLDVESRAAHEQRRAVIRGELETLASTPDPRPAAVGAADPLVDAPLSETEFERALAGIEERARTRREQVEMIRVRVGAFLSDYEARAPALRETIEQHQLAFERAREFKAAVELARDTLRELAQQTHQIWAQALQASAMRFLEATHSDVSELHFDQGLGLRIVQDGRVMTGEEARRMLSAGALDAVFLAARLAVGEFLGGTDAPLPLLLDDPFANADDRRLVTSLRALVDAIAPRQQVLLMACQHSRYEWAVAELEREGALCALRLSDSDPGA